jgi:hypothetical protein
MFRLTKQEKAFVVQNVTHLSNLKFASTTPFAFTEPGALMLASQRSEFRQCGTGQH